MLKILVVEDDEKLNQIICTYLARNQYQPTGCFNAKEAYDALSAGDYSLIISDIMMPKINGFEFVQTVRETNPEIPILFVTALDDMPSKIKGFHSGVDDYMVKPIEMDELILRVVSVLYKLLSHPRKVFTRSELLNEYWDMDNDSGLRTVDVYVARLRNKLAACKDFEIVTVHGFGYKAVLK